MNLPDLAVRLALRHSGRQWRGRCILCGKDALSLSEGRTGALLVHCFAGCAAEALLDALRSRALIEDAPAAPPRLAKEPPPPLDWSSRAEHLWRKGAPIAGTIVEIYLKSRGCALPQSGDIRFLEIGAFGPFPCMMARVTDAVTARPITLHFTRLKCDGGGKAAVDRPKLLLGGHRKTGGAIRLVDDAEVTLGLGLSEGIETGLAVMAGGWSPLWATVDAGNMAGFPVLDGIESLTLFADNDASGTGRRAAEACARRWRDAGREAGIVMPMKTGTDFNDVRAA
ncbi:MAG TPA: toprim domain-containing protein [Candidatus Cybelea sp.]|nr:toprim domain-containing protein [Candidatus Cybelea sp.]